MKKTKHLFILVMLAPLLSLYAQDDRTGTKLRIAMVQMKVVGGDLEGNLTRASDMVSEAARNGARLALLPECMDLGWTHPSSLEKATRVPGGQVFKALTRMAKQNRIFICAGLTERDKDKVYNAAVLIDDEGNLLLKHRKINELDIGKPYYATGDRLNVADTRLGRIGVMICADASVEDRSILNSLARMEPWLILSPSAWAVPPDFDPVATPYGDTWRNAYIPAAEKFSAYIVSVSNVGDMNDGPWKGWDCIGASLAIDNTGKEIIQCPYGVNAESITYVDCVAPK